MRSRPRTWVCRPAAAFEVRLRGQHLVGQRQQGGAIPGQVHALRAAREQGQAGGRLQALDLQADRGLGQGQFVSGA